MDDNLAAHLKKSTFDRHEKRDVRALLDDVANHLGATFDDDNPWDRSSAEALARVYEEAPPSTLAPQASTRAPAFDERKMLSAFSANLEGVASRLSEEISRLDPSHSMTGLVGSLKVIEERLAARDEDKSVHIELGALSTAIAALQADIRGVAAIDAQLKAFAGDVDSKLSELGRKELGDKDIERMSQAVSDLMALRLEAARTADLTEHSIERIAGQVTARVVNALPPPAAPVQVPYSDDELRRVAESIGRVLVHRVTATLQSSQGGQQGGEELAELRSLLESSFQDRRNSDEQLTGMLTTMQQALIGLLDRMDALERQPVQAAPEPVSVALPDPQPTVAPLGGSQAPSGFVAFDDNPAPAGLGQAGGKDDFLSAARRAAADAQQQQQPPRPASGKGPQAKAARAAGKAKKASSNGSALPRRLLLALLAVVAAASAYVALTRKPARQAPPPAAVERPDAPKKSSAVEGMTETDVVDIDQARQHAVSPLDALRRQEQEGLARLTAQLQRTSAVQTTQDNAPDATSREMPPAMVGPLSLRMAARDGNPSAQFAVAARLGEGHGVGQDLEQAMRWYHRAAQQGFALAQYRLGTYYERGLGVERDVARAQAWYRRAAEQGNAKAMHNLAVLATSREADAAPNYPFAAQWFARAADLGIRDSLFNLAVLYESGLGVQQDFGRAYFNLALAARAGDQQAVRRLDSVRNKLTPALASQIDDAVAAWEPKALDPIANNPVLASNAWQANATGATGG